MEGLNTKKASQLRDSCIWLLSSSPQSLKVKVPHCPRAFRSQPPLSVPLARPNQGLCCQAYEWTLLQLWFKSPLGIRDLLRGYYPFTCLHFILRAKATTAGSSRLCHCTPRSKTLPRVQEHFVSAANSGTASQGNPHPKSSQKSFRRSSSQVAI